MKTSGLWLTENLADIPQGAWRTARNIVVRNGRLYNEAGFEVYAVDEVENETPIIGIIETPEEIIEFRTDGADDCQINRITNGVRTTILKDAALAFRNPIEGVFRYKYNGDLEIAWWDGIEENSNNPRIMNLDNPGFDINPDGSFVDPSDIVLINLFFDTHHPLIELKSVNNSGGVLETGCYSMFFFYETEDGSRTFSKVMGNVVYIAAAQVGSDTESDWRFVHQGNDGGQLTTKSITINLTNIDTKFKKIGVGVLQKSNGIVTAWIDRTHPISGSTQTLTITGYNKEYTSLEEVIVPKAYYNRVKTGDVSNNRLYIANLKTELERDLQEIANKIIVKWDTEYANSISINDDGPAYNFKDPKVIYSKRTFMPGEVYALYAGFHFTNGDLKIHHIPGRAARINQTYQNSSADTWTPVGLTDPFTANEKDLVAGIIAANPTLALHDLEQAVLISNDVKYYEVFDTSSSNGTLGYHENYNEVYPADFPQYAGQNVRHHKIPTVEALKGYNGGSNVFDASSVPLTDITGTVIQSLMLIFENIDVPLDLQDKLSHIEFFYAARNSSNSTHMGMSYAARPNTIDGLNILNTNPFGLEDGINEALRFYPFTQLKERPVLNVTHIRSHYLSTYETETLEDGRLYNALFEDKLDLTDYTGLRAVSAFGYLNANTDQTGTIGVHGYDNNEARESCILVEFDGAYQNLGFKMMFASLFGRNKDCYFPYDGQEIVSTGINILPNATTVTSNGGDTFIVPWAMKSKALEGIGGASNIKFWVLPLGIAWEVSNMWFRQQGEQVWELFAPNSDPTAFGFDYSEADEPFIWDNFIRHNNDYAAVQNVIPYAAYFDDGLLSTDSYKVDSFPYRVARSIPQPNEGREQSWRTFLYNEYIEMPANKGEVWVLRVLNKHMAVHQKYSLHVLSARDTMLTNNIQAALGRGDFFTTDPDEIIPGKTGYFGTQSQWAAFVCPHGYVAIDKIQGIVGLFNGSFVRLSDPRVEQFIRENVHVDHDNPFNDSGWTGSYDDVHNRILLTRITEKVNPEFTLSYSFNSNSWVGFHDYLPNYSFYNQRGIFHVSVNKIYRQVLNNFGIFFDEDPYPSYVDFALVNVPKNFSLNGVNFVAELINDNNVKLVDRTISHIMCYNEFQCSGLVPIKNGVSLSTAKYNVRRIGDRWYFNNIKDATVDREVKTVSIYGSVNSANINTLQHWRNKPNWLTTHTIVRLMYDNQDGFKVCFVEVNPNVNSNLRYNES